MVLVEQAEKRYGLRAPTPSQSVPTQERGDSGGRAVAGQRQFGDEKDPNALWRPPNRWATVHKMRTLPDAMAAMDAIVLSLLSVDLEIEPGIDPATGKPGPIDEEIADIVWSELNNSSTSLEDLRFEAMDTALWYGCTPYQIVMDDYDWHLQRYPFKKLAFRPPWSIVQWHQDDFGGPLGITQLTDDSAYEDFSIDDLAVFVHRRKGGDLTGEPLSRRLYGAWNVLDKLYRIAPAGAYRQSMGVPVMTTPQGGRTEEIRIEELLEGLAADAYSYIRLAHGQTLADFAIKGMEGGRIDPVPLLEFFSKRIFLATFTQGQVLGSDQVGSYALSETQMSMLQILLRAIGRMETTTFNRYLIPKWVAWNWPGMPKDRLPKLRAPSPDTRAVAEFFASVLQAQQAGIPLDREAVRQRAHDLLGIPLPDEQTEGPTADPAQETVVEGQATARPLQLAAPERQPLRSEIRLRELGIEPNWHRMGARLDSIEVNIFQALRRITDEAIANLVNRARDIFRSGDAGMVRDTEVRGEDEMARTVALLLGDAYDDGAGEAIEELERQGVQAQPVPGDRKGRDRGFIQGTARSTAGQVADRLRSAFGQEVLGQLRSGEANPDQVGAALKGLSDTLVKDRARQDVSAVFGMGRLAGSEANANAVAFYINSEVLDPNTCEDCIDADGIDVQAKDAKRYAPYHACQGRQRCRGQLIPVTVRGDHLPPVKSGDI